MVYGATGDGTAVPAPGSDCADLTPCLLAYASDTGYQHAKFDAVGTVNLATAAVLPLVFDFNRTVGAAYREARLRYLRQRVFTGLATLERIRVHTDQRPHRSCGMSAFSIEGMTPDQYGGGLRSISRGGGAFS